MHKCSQAPPNHRAAERVFCFSEKVGFSELISLWSRAKPGQVVVELGSMTKTSYVANITQFMSRNNIHHKMFSPNEVIVICITDNLHFIAIDVGLRVSK